MNRKVKAEESCLGVLMTFVVVAAFAAAILFADYKSWQAVHPNSPAWGYLFR